MKRAVIVSTATLAGLAGVLTFHTAPVALGIAGLGASAGASTTPGTSPTTTTTIAGPPPPASHATSPGATPDSGVRSAVGDQVNYYFGILSVSVTAKGHTITKLSIASLNDGGNYRSQQIDQASIPLLIQQGISAQSARIQGVSGASYTSAGFAQSLQSALKKLGI